MTVPPPTAPGLGPATVLGYPRIGPNRELKWALEAYWEGRTGADELRATGRELRAATWRRLAALGLAAPVSNTFSLYDHVLDTALLLDAVPDRYRALAGPDGDRLDAYLDSYFAMARGTDRLAPLPMTKWFDTNYHHLVPEIGPDTPLRLRGDKPLAEVREARALGMATRPVLLGPVTFLLLSRPAPGSPAGFAPLDRLPDVLDAYARLLNALHTEGVGWVQLDEPALVTDRTRAELDAVAGAYRRLGELADRPRLLVATYFGDPGEALPVLAAAPVEAVAVDLVRAPEVAYRPELAALGDGGRTLVAGVVSGRDVWRTGTAAALALLRDLRARAGEVVVATSCPLLHVPYDLAAEPDLDPDLRRRLAFADQKVAEVVELAARLAEAAPGPDGPVPPPAPAPADRPVLSGPAERPPYPERAAAQAARLGLPLPVTTIGSFPQTGDLRAARAQLAAGQLDQPGYEARIEAEIARAIGLQERLGIDVLVHGEPERNDMVQYFAEHLEGFATTRHGWVQSYGSRCTRPPILHADVRRPSPITVRWSTYAQSLTGRPVKGMLTGPVTIVAWSFVRRDLDIPTVVGQVAEAIRAEVRDLEAAGIGIIQVDEPALRELLPLRRAQQAEYLAWAVAAYRTATSGAGPATQIHTHLCYSDTSQILAAIDALDADVTTIESARSGGRILAEPALAAFGRGLGPGLYDIHSTRIPDPDEIAAALAGTLRVLPRRRVWINPDCGLKTRTYPQVEAALANLVTAARRLRGTALSAEGAGE
jgi:5-methyltetrahydropteroyltriglutamate--homocysteine methyltransferase